MSEEQNEVMELDTNVESIEEEVTLEEMPEKETVDSFELTLEELDSLSNESKKVKADETHQKVVRFINQKKIATITKNIKGKDVYQFSSSSGTLLVAKFNSAAAKIQMEDILKKDSLTWETIKEEVVEGVKKTSYKATHPTLGNIYFTSFYSVPKKGQDA